jgi:hypothetical protein
MRPEDGRRPPRERLIQAVVLAALMMASLGSYLTVLKWRGPAATRTTQTAWDRYIPFCPSWVWVYLFPYLLGPFIAASLSRATFRWFVTRALTAVFVSLAIFVVVPTRTVRPPASDLGEGLTAALYRNMVGIDEPPANAAPSLHVSLTCLLAWAVARDYRRWWLAAVGGAVVVWLATLLTHQHHLLDVASGAALAAVLALVWRSN